MSEAFQNIKTITRRELSGYFASPVAYVLLAVYLAAYVGAFAAVWAWVAPRSLVGQILLPPTLWTALEFARTYALTGFPWGFLAYTQAGNLPLIQMAAWSGMYGVSWILVLANAGLVLLAIITVTYFPEVTLETPSPIEGEGAEMNVIVFVSGST